MPDDPWAGFPTPEPFIDPNNQFVTPGLKKGLPPAQYKLPNIEEMRLWSQTPEGRARLAAVLEQYGVTNSMNHMKTLASDYVQRMTGLTGEDYKRAVNELITSETRRGALGMNREIAQQYSSLRAIEGNINQRMIWVSEGDDHTCEECDARAGEIQTFTEWQAEGPPGSRVCLGGSYCRCDLLPID
jgi:hypothetical protein